MSSINTWSQEKKRVVILSAEIAETDVGNSNAQRLVGNQVNLQHEDILIWCDTAYTYSDNNNIDALKDVHISRGDTLHLYADKIHYNGDSKFAQAIGNVKLINKTTSLYTDTLDYDLNTNIAYYDNYGTIVDSTNTLSSEIGQFFVDENTIHFYKNVRGNSENYSIVSDTLFYNTKDGKISIEGPTTIVEKENTLYTEEGWYNSNTGEAELFKNSRVSGLTQDMWADYINYNKENGDGTASGNIRIIDYENKLKITGENIFYNDITEKATVTDSAVLMLFSEPDTLFLHADTLRTVPDTIEEEKIVSAFYNVRYFRTDIQGICDSLVYYSKDSVVKMNIDPIIWSENHQLSADLIEMKQYRNAPDEIHLTNDSFIISKQDSNRFDQIKGKNMVGYVVNEQLNNIEVDGNGESLYYAREENDEIIGLNRAEASNISIRFKDGEIFKIGFTTTPNGILKPIADLTEQDRTLDGFDWKIQLRPLTKYDIFRNTKSVIEEEANFNNITSEN